MKREAGAIRYVRRGIIGAGVLLPTLSLVPFGSYWLWQNGYLLHWGLAAVAVTTAAFAFQYWLLRPVVEAGPQRPEGVWAEDGEEGSWSPRESMAWRDVLDIAEKAGVEELSSQDAALALGKRTVEAVAKRLNPSVKDPLWTFTVPEALALIERVSARLRPFIENTIPLGDRLTVGQVMKLYRWTGLVDQANRAYDLWRIVRLVNPLSAAMSEAREKFSRKLYEWGRDELARRLARAYVKEVGRAAIDLYGGRLRVTDDDLQRHTTAETAAERSSGAIPEGEPLRILAGGQTSVGKSSLINALSKDTVAAVDVLPATEGFTPYELAVEGVPSAVVIDSPAIDEQGAALSAFVAKADSADLVLWVVSAARADRKADRDAMDALRSHFAGRLDRVPPKVLVVATHIDKLRPFQEWRPPYDLRDETNAKAASIRASIAAIAADLGVETEDIVPVRAEGGAAYNIEALWAKILEHAPEARRARLVRIFAELRSRRDWTRVLEQAKNAGRLLIGAVARGT